MRNHLNDIHIMISKTSENNHKTDKIDIRTTNNVCRNYRKQCQNYQTQNQNYRKLVSRTIDYN